MPFDLYLLRSTTQQLSDIHVTAEPKTVNKSDSSHQINDTNSNRSSSASSSSSSSSSSSVHSQLRNMAAAAAAAATVATTMASSEDVNTATTLTPATTTLTIASTTSTSSVSSSHTRLPATLAGTPFALTRLLLELAPVFRAVDWLLDILEWKQPSRSLLVLAFWWIACAASEWLYIYMLHWIVAGAFLWWYWQRRQIKPTAPHTAVDANGAPIVSSSPIRDDADDLRAVSRTLDALNVRLGRLRLKSKRLAARADLAAGDILRWWLYSYPPWCLFNYQLGARWSVAALGGLLISWRSPWMQFMYRFATSWLPRVISRFQRRLNAHQDNPLYAPLIQAASLAAQIGSKTKRRNSSLRQRRRSRPSSQTTSSTFSSVGQSTATDSMLPIPEESRDEPQDTTCPDAQAKLQSHPRSINGSAGFSEELPASSSSSDIDDPLFNSISLEKKRDFGSASGNDSDQYSNYSTHDYIKDSDEEDEAAMLAMHTGLTHRIILLEHQRWWVGLGWLTRFLPFDPYPWTDEEGHEAPSRELFTLPAPTTVDLLPKRQLGMVSGQLGSPDLAAVDDKDEGNGNSANTATQQTLGWKWVDTQWQVDQDTSPHLIDMDGWSYADNTWSGWRSAPWLRAYTRRRRWWRRAMLVEVEQG
ncbi:integral peroxisomal membrane peroxin-domain-containing protein [Syncephalis fuscata]|nr:integral peroxisomal membrane peroxin-domain-containing protein [Syncephalis fuscata]